MAKEFAEHEVTVTITITTYIDCQDCETHYEACEHVENDVLENGIKNYNVEFQFDKEKNAYGEE